MVMEGSSSDEPGINRSLEGISNGIASMIPFNSDDDDNCEPNPSELYGKYTWIVDKFSQINKKGLRSNAFDIGGYKWYILMYPEGCDVQNHISLFLCVANHDKLLPGWGHLAQFTITIFSKNPRKTKSSDVLHRFCKKEHDWGWKKYVHLSKLQSDEYLVDDTLTIKAQVQVIRNTKDGPFRCLESGYRSELAKVYMSKVEEICNRFVVGTRVMIAKVIEDKVRWSRICKFWQSMDQNYKHLMSSEKSKLLLKCVVEHFFKETEVASTLVMESLYYGLKSLKGKARAKGKCVAEEAPISVVMDNDTFSLVGDALLLFEREAFTPLPPCQEKDHQNKDGGGSSYVMNSVARDKMRLAELGQRTIETFVVFLIFSKIDKAHSKRLHT